MNATTFASFAISQLTTSKQSAGHALELGDSLTPNVLQSDKGIAPQRRRAPRPNALTRSMQLSPAERQAKATAFHPRHASNFAIDPMPSKVIPRAGRAFATA